MARDLHFFFVTQPTPKKKLCDSHFFFGKNSELHLFVAQPTLFLIHDLLPKKISELRFFLNQARYTFFITQPTLFLLRDLLPKIRISELRFFKNKKSKLHFFCYATYAFLICPL